MNPTFPRSLLLANQPQKPLHPVRPVFTQAHAFQFPIGDGGTVVNNVPTQYQLGEEHTQIAAQSQSQPIFQAYTPQAAFQSRLPQSFPRTDQEVVDTFDSQGGNLFNLQSFWPRQELPKATSQLSHPPVTSYEQPNYLSDATPRNSQLGLPPWKDINSVSVSIRELPPYRLSTVPPPKPLEETTFKPFKFVSRRGEPLRYEADTSLQSILQGRLSSLARNPPAYPPNPLLPQIRRPSDRSKVNTAGGYSTTRPLYQSNSSASTQVIANGASLDSIQTSAPQQAPRRPNLGGSTIWTFLPVGHPRNRQFKRAGLAIPLTTAPSISAQRGPETLVNNILVYAGLLLPNSRVDYTKLDSRLNIKPAFDKDPYSGLADSQVIVLSDNLDGEHLSRKDTKGSFANMPPRTGNGLYPQNEAAHEGLGDGNLRKTNGVSQELFDFTPRQSNSLRKSMKTGNSPFAVVIPTPSPAKLHSSMAHIDYNHGEYADLSLVDEHSSTTRISASATNLSNSHLKSRSSTTPSVPTGFSISPNGKKRGRPFATPEAAAKAAAKLQRLAARRAFTSQQPSPKPASFQRPFPNPATSSESLTINGKKRGRPFQTPEGAAAAAEARAVKIARIENLDSAEPKKRGRPFTVTKEIEIPDGIYKSFFCEFKDCPAELHNLDTLRQHLHVVHGARDKRTRMIPCRWAKCAGKYKQKPEVESKDKATEDANIEKSRTETSGMSQVVEFSSKAEWKKHIEEEHLIPFSWHMGDGPSVGSFSPPSKRSLSQTDPWLFDNNGNQVTPSVKYQRLEAGRASFNNSRRFAKQKRHDVKSAQHKSTMPYTGGRSDLISGEASKKTAFDIIPPAVVSPHEYIVIHASDSEDELAADVSGDLGIGLGHSAEDEVEE